MTNHIKLTEIDGEVYKLDTLLTVRNGKRVVQQLAEEEGLEEAAKNVCRYCSNFVPDDRKESHDCMEERAGFAPSSYKAPI